MHMHGYSTDAERLEKYLKKTLKILEKDLGKYYFHFRCHI